MAAAVYAVMGLAVSAAIPNTFVAVTSPLFMAIVVRSGLKFLPKAVYLPAIHGGNSLYGAHTFEMLFFSFMTVMGYILIFGSIFGFFVKRRVANEII